MKPNLITIRLATVHDAEIIADLSRKTFFETFGEQNTQEDMDIFLGRQFTKEELIREVHMPANTFLLAYAGDQLAGYVKLREGEIPPEIRQFKSLEIARLYAVSNMIGKGVGRELMRHCINMARQQHIDVLWLAVWEKNPRAVEFYTKWGFEKFGQQLFLLGTDLQNDWMMKKWIGVRPLLWPDTLNSG